MRSCIAFENTYSLLNEEINTKMWRWGLDLTFWWRRVLENKFWNNCQGEIVRTSKQQHMGNLERWPNFFSLTECSRRVLYKQKSKSGVWGIHGWVLPTNIPPIWTFLEQSVYSFVKEAEKKTKALCSQQQIQGGSLVRRKVTDHRNRISPYCGHAKGGTCTWACHRNSS